MLDDTLLQWNSLLDDTLINIHEHVHERVNADVSKRWTPRSERAMHGFNGVRFTNYLITTKLSSMLNKHFDEHVADDVAEYVNESCVYIYIYI